MTLTTSRQGVEFIAKHEGCRLKAYLCPAKVWTIGYGTTSLPDGSPVERGMTITQEQAKQYLAHDVKRFERNVNGLVSVPLTQNQFDALVSFVYNIGAGAFGRSTLLEMLNKGGYAAVPDQLMRWTMGGGKTLPGLVKRRLAEAELWRNGKYA